MSYVTLANTNTNIQKKADISNGTWIQDNEDITESTLNRAVNTVADFAENIKDNAIYSDPSKKNLTTQTIKQDLILTNKLKPATGSENGIVFTVGDITDFAMITSEVETTQTSSNQRLKIKVGKDTEDELWLSVTDKNAVKIKFNNSLVSGTVWHEGNDGVGSGLDADKLQGYTPAVENTANTVVLRSSTGSFNANEITASKFIGNATSLYTTLTPDKGGTGLTSYNAGDLLFGNIVNSAPVIQTLSTQNKNGKFLSVASNGLPIWSEITLSSGTLGLLNVTNGGTGLSTLESKILKGNGTSPLSYADANDLVSTIGIVPVQKASNLNLGELGSVPIQLSAGSTTFVSPNKTSTLKILTQIGNGTAVTNTGWTSTNGSGNVVLSTSPTLVSPILGHAFADSIELGTDGATPSIDFHSGSNSGDYSARIISTGGNGTGTATLNIQAGQILIPEGTASKPGIGFQNDGATDSGLYHISDGSFGVTCNAIPVATFTPSGTSVNGNFTATGSMFAKNALFTASNGITLRNNGGTLDYGVIQQVNSGYFHILSTNVGDSAGAFNDFRPLALNLATGDVSIGINANGAANSKLVANLDSTSTAVTATYTDNYTSIATTAFATPRTSSTGASFIPVGTTLQRPSDNINGLIRYNTDIHVYEGYNSNYATWNPFGGGAVGGGQDKVFYLNDIHVTQSYTIPDGQNAMSAGPLIIDPDVIITIPTNSNWSIV
jgi:hypothetical protein